MGGVELIERACLARGVTQHQLRVGVACSHRRHSTRTAGRGSELNVAEGPFRVRFLREMRVDRPRERLCRAKNRNMFCI